MRLPACRCSSATRQRISCLPMVRIMVPVAATCTAAGAYAALVLFWWTENDQPRRSTSHGGDFTFSAPCLYWLVVTLRTPVTKTPTQRYDTARGTFRGLPHVRRGGSLSRGPATGAGSGGRRRRARSWRRPLGWRWRCWQRGCVRSPSPSPRRRAKRSRHGWIGSEFRRRPFLCLRISWGGVRQ